MKLLHTLSISLFAFTTTLFADLPPSLYVFSQTTSAEPFQLNRTSPNGLLSYKSPANIANGGIGNKVLVNSNFAKAYVAFGNEDISGGINVFTINQVSGNLSLSQTLSISYGSLDCVLSPNGRYLYATTGQFGTSGQIRLYLVDSQGNLSFQQSFATENGAIGLAISSDGSSLYSTNNDSQSIQMWNINPSDGTISQKSGSPLSVSFSPNYMNISSDGKNLYVTGNSGGDNTGVLAAYTISSVDGTLSQLGSTLALGTNLYGAVLSPDNKFYYLATLNQSESENALLIYSRNLSTGALSQAGSFSDDQNVYYGTLAISSSGNTIYSNGTSKSASPISYGVFTLARNATTGLLTNSQFLYLTTNSSSNYAALGITPNDFSSTEILFSSSSYSNVKLLKGVTSR